MREYPLKLASLTLWCALFLSQFYIVSSGLPQISHFLLLVFAIVMGGIKSGYKVFDKDLLYLLLFGFYSLVVNTVYSIMYEEPKFYMFNIYFFYNVIIMINIVKICFKNKVDILTQSLSLSLLLLCVFHVIGLGRYNYGFRYNGFFNDPNQMAFWALCSCSLICILSSLKTIRLLSFGMCVYICIASASRSALVGLLILFIGLIFSCYDIKGPIRLKYFKILAISTCLLIILPIISYLLSSIEDVSLLFDRFLSTDFEDQADIRGYSRFLKYPEYLIFGAGQALDERFSTNNEVHSTWAAFAFYYGIIGFSLFSMFIFKIFRNLNVSEKLLFLAPLFYSLSTFGARTPIFYVFLGVYIFSMKKK